MNKAQVEKFMAKNPKQVTAADVARLMSFPDIRKRLSSALAKKPIKVDIPKSGRYVRFRMQDPKKFKDFRTKAVGKKGTKLVIGCPNKMNGKCKSGMKLQSVLIPKDRVVKVARDYLGKITRKKRKKRISANPVIGIGGPLILAEASNLSSFTVGRLIGSNDRKAIEEFKAGFISFVKRSTTRYRDWQTALKAYMSNLRRIDDKRTSYAAVVRRQKGGRVVARNPLKDRKILEFSKIGNDWVSELRIIPGDGSFSGGFIVSQHRVMGGRREVERRTKEYRKAGKEVRIKEPRKKNTRPNPLLMTVTNPCGKFKIKTIEDGWINVNVQKSNSRTVYCERMDTGAKLNVPTKLWAENAAKGHIKPITSTRKSVRGNPKSGRDGSQELSFGDYMEWARNDLPAKDMKRLNKAVKRYKEFHKGKEPDTVLIQNIPLGQGGTLRDFVIGMGKSPTETYVTPKGSGKGSNQPYLHEYKNMPDSFTTVEGNFIGKPLPRGVIVDDWIRG